MAETLRDPGNVACFTVFLKPPLLGELGRVTTSMHD